MRFEYDQEANAAYIYIADVTPAGKVKKTHAMNDEIILDFSEDMQLLGVEILNASKYLSEEVLAKSLANKNLS